jgi:predicted dehydrogenase/threonine dehydrogenase-like Zn-dependent dehydrogenase
MKQVVQRTSGGPVRVVDVPRPAISATEVLVRTMLTSMSPGTERAMTALAQSGLVAKARARPDLARQVLRKARDDGFGQTVRAVRARLDDDIPLGYSGVGEVIEVGEAVTLVRAGQLVATGGAGKANHAEFQAVPGNLCVPGPEGVTSQDAALSTIAAIAQHGLHQAEVTAGGKLAVIGLGLVGQLTIRLARAAGVAAYGLDVNPAAVAIARGAGFEAEVDAGSKTTSAVRDWARGRGVDAVVITASSKESTIVARAPALCRDRAIVVVVGDVGLELDRRPFYEQELTLRFARSYGPGRYDPSYEDWGVDYPIGYVRWTERRNMEAVLDLMKSGSLRFADLVTHTFPIERAPDAYEMVTTGTQPFMGVQLSYDHSDHQVAAVPRISRVQGQLAIGVLLPSFKAAGMSNIVSVASASGLSAHHLAERVRARKPATTPDELLEDPDIDTVIVATSHESHASFVVRALHAGKHVFCEKPLALSFDELAQVEEAAAVSGTVLFVGFNRRWSGPVKRVIDHFARGAGPLVVTYRVNAGPVPHGHWYNDRRQGGRLIGEVGHFVDTCGAMVGVAARDVFAAGSGSSEVLLSSDVVLALAYPEGSLATISYASGGAHVDKEHIEILGRGRSAAIIDFREVVLDGERTSVRPQDKGHLGEAQAFFEMVRGDRAQDRSAFESSRTVLLAADHLRRASTTAESRG